jgi:hypothetical protein
MGISTIWLNTGTFKRMYAGDLAAETELGVQQRRDILGGVTAQAEQLQARGFQVSVNLFAADKSLIDEHVDWSYWQPGKAHESSDTVAFDMFVRGLRERKIGFSLYDQINDN